MENFLYLITSNIVNGIKIGKTSEWMGLKNRYKTTYGNKLDIYVFACEDRHKDEKTIHRYFKDYNLAGEIFNKEYLEEYIEYCNSRYTLIYPFTMTIKNDKFMSDESKLYDDLEIPYDYTNSYLDYDIKSKNLKTLDGEYIQIDKENPLYRDDMDVEYTFEYNTITIKTGDDSGLIGIKVHNDKNNIELFENMCEDRCQTITTNTINKDRDHLFLLTNEQKKMFKGEDLSIINIFDLSINIIYEGQILYGSTYICHEKKCYKCQVDKDTIKYGVSPLPDVIFKEICYQILKKEKITNNFNNTCQSSNIPHKDSQNLNDSAVVRLVNNIKTSNLDYDNLSGENIDSMILVIQTVIGCLQNIKPNFTNKDAKLIRTNKRLVNKMIKYEEDFQSVKDYVFERLTITDNRDHIIKGDDVAAKFFIWVGASNISLTSFYDMLVKCKVTPHDIRKVRHFVGVEYTFKEDRM
jgi:hypothetical protein